MIYDDVFDVFDNSSNDENNYVAVWINRVWNKKRLIVRNIFENQNDR